jgi:hypothetical protein
MANLDQIAEGRWISAIEGQQLSGLLDNRTLKRKITGVNVKDIVDLVEVLRTRVSVKNPDNGTRYYSVTDPMVNGVVQPGTWRGVTVESVEGVHNAGRVEPGGTITQTLAFGWIKANEALPTPILLTDDKMLLSPFVHDTDSVKNAYVWEYRWIDPAYAQTLRNTIALTAGVIDAKIIKEQEGYCNIQVLTQSNTWNGNIDDGHEWEIQNQAHGFAAEKIIETFTHIAPANLAAHRTTLQTPTSGYKVSSLIDSLDSAGGFASITQTQDKLFPGAVTDANGTLQEEEYLQLITSGIIRTTMWLAVPDADLATSMATVAVAPAGYTVLKVSNNYNGTGSFVLIRTMMLLGTVADPMLMKVDWPTFEDEHRTYFYFGMDKTTAESTLVTAQTVCDAGYKVDSAEIQEWKYNTFVVIQQISKVQVTPFTVSAVHQQNYIASFGLVTRATTVYLNVPKASIDTVKTAINAIANIIVLEINDNDNGQGAADITYTWRSKESAPRSLGALRTFRQSRFHKEEENRLWIDINLTDKDALATAVAQAMAGTAPYAVATGAEIREINGTDAGDKTGTITQRVVKEGTPDPADYSMLESFNPHGLQEAVMIISVREYPEVDYSQIAVVFALLRTFLGTPEKGRIQVSLNGNGSFMMRALKEGTPDWSNTVPAYVKTEVQNPGTIGEIKTELATGIPIAGAAAIVAAGSADADYALNDIQMQERGMGEAAITKRQTKKSETAVQIVETPSLGLRRATKHYTWPLVLDANFAAVWAAAATEGVDGDYILEFRQKNILGGGMVSIESHIVECTEVTVPDRIVAYTKDSYTSEEVHQDASSIPAATDTTGTIITYRGSLNLHNKYDYVKTTVTRRDNGTGSRIQINSPNMISEGVIIDGQTAEPTTLGVAYGHLEYSKDEFGRYKGRRIVNTLLSTGWWLVGLIYSVNVKAQVESYGNGFRYYRTLGYTITVKGWANQTQAAAEIEGGLSHTPVGSSKVEKLDSGFFHSTKITLYPTYDDPALSSTVGEWYKDKIV